MSEIDTAILARFAKGSGRRRVGGARNIISTTTSIYPGNVSEKPRRFKMDKANKMGEA
jgi:hypothetical protein